MSVKNNSGKSKNNKSHGEIPIEDINVKLKPVLGISPRSYVPAIWLLIILIIGFLLLILPGIKQNGSWITVESLPADASVIVDDIRLGSSGNEVFIPHGHRSLVVRRTGFQPEVLNIEVQGRIFASKVFPLKKSIAVELSAENENEILSRGIRNFAEWAATGPEEGRYSIPPVLTQTGRDLLQAGYNPSEDLLKASLPLSIDERQLADILRAEYIISSRGAPPGLGSIVEFINRAAENSGDIAYTPALSLMNPERLGKWGISDIEESESKAFIAEKEYDKARATRSFPTQLLAGRRFISIPRITLPIGDMEVISSGYNPRSGAVPVEAALDAYFISALEVSNREFSNFISENPEWSVENRESLIVEGIADDAYLTDWGLSGYAPGTAGYPVTDVSWYAAEAYARWFTDLFLKGSGLTARLPREDEWEVAARLNSVAGNTSELSNEISTVENGDIGTIGIIGMAGNVREWALNPYRVNENLFRPHDGSPGYQSSADPLSAPLRPVRGGAFIDKNLHYPVATRGGLKPEITSPVIGFRLVISPSSDF